MLHRDLPQQRWFRSAPVLSIAFAVVLVASLALVSVLVRGGEDGPPRAVIVDQLSLTHPNPDFRKKASSLLEEAGFTVDYYSGVEATVRLYQNLANGNYAYVILRNHSALMPDHMRGDLGLFTVEPASQTKYVREQQTFRLAYARYFDEGPRYFSVGSGLIASSSGEFDNATVILMGCDGLTYSLMAEAFVKKGATGVIGWDGLVSAEHTDAATLDLLGRLLHDDLSAQDAAAAVMADLGPDPWYESVLLSYPPEG